MKRVSGYCNTLNGSPCLWVDPESFPCFTTAPRGLGGSVWIKTVWDVREFCTGLQSFPWSPGPYLSLPLFSFSVFVPLRLKSLRFLCFSFSHSQFIWSKLGEWFLVYLQRCCSVEKNCNNWRWSIFTTKENKRSSIFSWKPLLSIYHVWSFPVLYYNLTLCLVF